MVRQHLQRPIRDDGELSMLRIVVIAITFALVYPALAAEPPLRVMRALLFNLHAGIEAACTCSIHGVGVSQWSSYPDTSRWRIDWKDGTTDEQKAAGRAFLEAF